MKTTIEIGAKFTSLFTGNSFTITNVTDKNVSYSTGIVAVRGNGKNKLTKEVVNRQRFESNVLEGKIILH